jgi:hypothetical protein
MRLDPAAGNRRLPGAGVGLSVAQNQKNQTHFQADALGETP